MIHLNIGSNLDSVNRSKFENISIAIKQLIDLGLHIKKVSSFYETPSYPNSNLPRFINIGLIGEISSNYTTLLDHISIIEKKIGRVKSKKNDPRVCDIDIIDFNQMTCNTKLLTLPHPRLHMRNFVLYPIKEIDPFWMHPILKKNVDFLIKQLSQNSRIEITRLNKSVII